MFPLLQQKRKMRSNEVHYIDHPMLGLVIKLTPLDADALMLLAQAAGYRIKEIPVRWVDDPDTRVKVVSTAWKDVKGLLRLRFRGRPRPAASSS